MLKDAIYSEEIDMMPSLRKNIVGFGFDSVSENLGGKGGFVVRLQNFLRKKPLYYLVYASLLRIQLKLL